MLWKDSDMDGSEDALRKAKPAGWDEPDRLNREPVPAYYPPSSRVSDARASRWDGLFTEEEIRTIVGALKDSGGMRSDYGWYVRCSKLHVEAALAKVRGEKPNAT